ncbi:MAG: hypothetical protein LBE92_01905 [Chryseobacterium sp.]|jgi:hypothetical protein|uniref:hypothetical protein n=1 Tax=Chryseobacterium sp. TaxID=1871047 RepID=UPI00281DAEE6|nr:hypothetical protein [Chryseobacterium sp.]MDR2234853.1 hypothetical protein [Chryseobacterium sp.]
MYLRASTLFLINPGIDEQRHIFTQYSTDNRAVLNSIQSVVTKSDVLIRTSPDNGFSILLEIFQQYISFVFRSGNTPKIIFNGIICSELHKPDQKNHYNNYRYRNGNPRKQKYH